jgi:hypothetical protein
MFDRKIGQGTFDCVICKERSLRKPISSEAF